MGRLIENLKQLSLTLRDVFILFCPKAISKLFFTDVQYAFLAHPIEFLPDIARKYPFATKLPKWALKLISLFHPPIILSKVTGYRDKNGCPINGYIVFCSLTTRLMLLNENRARKKILQAVKFCEKLNVKLLGLGAFVPIVTDHGAFLRQNNVSMSITNGDAFSAIIAAKNVLKASKLARFDNQKIILAIVGAAGFVGSMSTKILSKHFKNLILIDRNIQKLNEVLNLIKNNKSINIQVSNDVSIVKTADIILTVTNAPGAIIRPHMLKPKSIIVDAAQPRNVSKKVVNEREDVIVIESGIAEIKGLKVNCDFGLKKENEVYSCFAELLLLCWLKNFEEDHIDNISDDYIKILMDNMEEAGIEVAEFRNDKGFIQNGLFKSIFNH